MPVQRLDEMAFGLSGRLRCWGRQVKEVPFSQQKGRASQLSSYQQISHSASCKQSYKYRSEFQKQETWHSGKETSKEQLQKSSCSYLMGKKWSLGFTMKTANDDCRCTYFDFDFDYHHRPHPSHANPSGKVYGKLFFFFKKRIFYYANLRNSLIKGWIN